MTDEFGGGGEIRFERRGRAGIVTLARPGALNAVTNAMIRALSRALDAWQNDDDIALVLVRAEGRVFSAGGDIVEIYRQVQSGTPPVEFFAEEYRLNHRIATFPKPYVALIDGLAMGGGVGISYHGSHRVVTENAVFAMPETGIGFFPDVGGSFFLPRLKGAFGIFLGLTGARIGWGDQLRSGLATHAVPSSRMDELVAVLCAGGNPARALKSLAVVPERETDEATLHAIDRHFALDRVEDISASLGSVANGDPFAARAGGLLAEKSPTSLKVTLAQLAAGQDLDMADCMRMEFRIANRMLAGHDFREGIRAAVIDKSGNPQWRPATLADVTSADVDAYFAPLAQGDIAL